MRDLLVVLLTLFAVHRLTYLVIADRIAREPRERLQNWFERRWTEKPRDPEERRQRRDTVRNSTEWQSAEAYFFSCPWCASIWVGGLTVILVAFTIGIVAPVLVWLAASSITGLLWNNE